MTSKKTATEQLAEAKTREAALDQKLAEMKDTLAVLRQQRAESTLNGDDRRANALRSQSVALELEAQDNEAALVAVRETVAALEAPAKAEREQEVRVRIAEVETAKGEALRRVETLAEQLGSAVAEARSATQDVEALARSIGVGIGSVDPQTIALSLVVRAGVVHPSAVNVPVELLRKLDPREAAASRERDRLQAEAQAEHDRRVMFGPENVRRAIEARMDSLADLVRAWKSHRHPSTRARINEVADELRSWVEKLPADEIEAARDELADVLAESTEPIRAIGA